MNEQPEISRLTSKHQATVPKRVREALHLKGGDTVLFKVKGKQVILEKAPSPDMDYLRMLDATLTEWHSPEDDELFKDL